MDGLIVTADDFGLSIEVNEAVEAAARAGVLSAASLMVSGSAAEDAVRRARRTPGLRVGLHLVLIDGAPTLPASEIPDLVDGSGRFRTDMVRLAFQLAASRAANQQLEAEIAAQFQAYARTGLPLDHVNAHKHFHLHPMVASKIVAIGRRFGMRSLRVPRENGRVLRKIEKPGFLPLDVQPWTGWLRAKARRNGLASTDWVFGLRWSGAMTLPRLSGLLANLPPGLVEIYTHPAVRDDFPGHAPGYRYQEEFSSLCHPVCANAIRGLGRPLGGYSDFVA